MDDPCKSGSQYTANNLYVKALIRSIKTPGNYVRLKILKGMKLWPYHSMVMSPVFCIPAHPDAFENQRGQNQYSYLLRDGFMVRRFISRLLNFDEQDQLLDTPRTVRPSLYKQQIQSKSPCFTRQSKAPT